ncbi:hypothetical protein NPX13_g4720 [Xylaria arbuscula]|uniref:Uncharacterized protein n=1 Tax=Xylaria arbuscula TaxID=114810 RepID=A0A9W8NG82_9PEZI|nr:hypothetical protein NPX13_g4720 [Xylaria arbuscula]
MWRDRVCWHCVACEEEVEWEEIAGERAESVERGMVDVDGVRDSLAKRLRSVGVAIVRCEGGCATLYLDRRARGELRADVSAKADRALWCPISAATVRLLVVWKVNFVEETSSIVVDIVSLCQGEFEPEVPAVRCR